MVKREDSELRTGGQEISASELSVREVTSQLGKFVSPS